MKRVSVDIGGTFTDCFVAWDDRYVEAKALTTHHNLAVGFNEALDIAVDDLALDRHTLLSQVDSVRYSTTLGTNALIERKGPRLGLLITEGFGSTVALLARARPRRWPALRATTRRAARVAPRAHRAHPHDPYRSRAPPL